MKYILFIAAAIAFVAYMCRGKKQKTFLIFTIFINKIQIHILSMQLDKKTFVESILALVDHDTQQPVEASFSNISLSSSDTSVFTADTDSDFDGNIDVVGVSEGTGTLTVTADATYTDANTGKEVTASKSATIEITVTTPPPGAQNTDLVVTFGPAEPVPSNE